MALIVAPYGTSQIKGSIGSKTFQSIRGGLIVRERTTPVNPNTPNQNLVRGAMTILSDRWTNGLTATQRDAWNDYAELTPLPNKFGELRNVGGRQMYIRSNLSRQSGGLSLVDTAPSTPGVAEEATFLVTTDTTVGVQLDSLGVSLAAGDFITMLLSPPLNQTRNYHSAPYEIVQFVTSATSLPLELKPPGEVAIGQRFFIRSRLYRANGKVGSFHQVVGDILT